MEYPQNQYQNSNQSYNQPNYNPNPNYTANEQNNQYRYYQQPTATGYTTQPVITTPMPIAPPPSPEEIARNNEKSAFRKRCNILGLMLLIANLIFSSVSTVIYLVYTQVQAGFALPESIDSIPDNIVNGLANSATFGIIAVIFIALLKLNGKNEVLVFEKVRFSKLMGLLAIGYTVSMLSNLMTNAFMSNAYTFGINLNFDVETPVSNSALEIIVYLISTAVVPAFSEEILFRGAMLGGLRRYGDAMAVFVSSFLFGLFHGNFIQFPFAFVVGLVLGFTVVYTNSILPAILIHFSNNAFSVVSDIMYTNADSMGISEGIIDIASFAFVICVAIVAIIAVIILTRRDKNFMKLKVYDGPMDIKTRNKTLVTTPLMIIVTVYLLLESVITHLTLSLVS